MKSFVIGAVFLLAAACNAASIGFVKHNNGRLLTNFVLIEGEIKAGDYDKFARFIIANKDIDTVYLASKGGNVAESLRIGYLIRDLYLRTSAPTMKKSTWLTLESMENNTCASSCFFLFVAGANRSGYLAGIHRPYMSTEDYKKTNLGAAKAGHDELRSTISKYLDTMNVPLKYVDLMFSTEIENMYWLTFEEISKDFNGYVPAIEEWMKANCKRVLKDDERNQKAIFARIPPDRRNMGMFDAITIPADKEALEQIHARLGAQVECELNALAVEGKKAREKLAVKYKK